MHVDFTIDFLTVISIIVILILGLLKLLIYVLNAKTVYLDAKTIYLDAEKIVKSLKLLHKQELSVKQMQITKSFEQNDKYAKVLQGYEKLDNDHNEMIHRQSAIIDRYKSRLQKALLYVNELEGFVRQNSGYVPKAFISHHKLKGMYEEE